MLRNKKVVVVMPAYNAEKTLEQTYREIDFSIVDEVILVDDASKDNTAHITVEGNPSKGWSLVDWVDARQIAAP